MLDFFDQCQQRQIGVLAAGVFNSGILATGTGSSASYGYRPAPADIVAREDWHDDHVTRLNAALVDLDERSRDILSSRWLGDHKATLHELADRYGVSAERIRQLEKNAMKKLRGALEAA